MNIPRFVELSEENQNVLHRIILDAIPNEGCALLIGKEVKEAVSSGEINLTIQKVWPCSNVWESGIFKEDAITPKESRDRILDLSRKNRFLISPTDQIQAQKWARSKNLKILGNAHSHPSSEGIPSKIDIALSSSHNLMIIVDSGDILRAWWIINKKQFQEIKIVSYLLSTSRLNSTLT
ncbi:M67 family metallopeptidase [Prochlorococcus sp. MIT 1223]|uniref:M67 family metallopeptidase n=1 Tax=Prochlorococcus sp. MIT 1223 TaxID=3096217 RepID=UPI002A76294F|nr:M67 family metallopeptidase [Prochlorococcus sp. MIT 1223]